MPAPTAKDVANWMLQTVKEKMLLPQDAAAILINEKFGKEFAYWTEKGNLAVRPDVLKEFRAIRGDEVIWDFGKKEWRVPVPGEAEARRRGK